MLFLSDVLIFFGDFGIIFLFMKMHRFFSLPNVSFFKLNNFIKNIY